MGDGHSSVLTELRDLNGSVHVSDVQFDPPDHIMLSIVARQRLTAWDMMTRHSMLLRIVEKNGNTKAIEVQEKTVDRYAEELAILDEDYSEAEAEMWKLDGVANASERTDEIAGSLRSGLRNSGAVTELNQRLAKRRNDTSDAKKFGKALDEFIRDIATLDTLWPDAKGRMLELDKAP